METVKTYEGIFDIAQKVVLSNEDYLYTPEEIFANYVFTNDTEEIVVDSNMLWDAIQGYFEAYYDDTFYPMYTLKLEELTEKEKEIFYDYLITTLKKMYDTATEDYTKNIIKEWLNLD